jgi:hypothetical protein
LFVNSYLDGWDLGWFWLLRSPLPPALTPALWPRTKATPSLCRGCARHALYGRGRFADRRLAGFLGMKWLEKDAGVGVLFFDDGCLGWVIALDLSYFDLSNGVKS